MDNDGQSTLMDTKENIPPSGAPAPGQRKSTELWRERNEVITLLEHRENLQIARDIVNDVVSRAVSVDKHVDAPHSMEHDVAASGYTPKTLSGVVPTEQKRTAVDILDVLEQKVSDELNNIKRDTKTRTANSPVRLHSTDSLNSDIGSQVCSPQSERGSFREILEEHAYSSPEAADKTDERLPTEAAGVSLAGGTAGFVECVAEEDLPYLSSEIVTTSDENEVEGSIEDSRAVVPHDVPGHATVGSLLDTAGKIVQIDVKQSMEFPHEMVLAHRNSGPSESSPVQHTEDIRGIPSCLAANVPEETRNVLADVAAESIGNVTVIQENVLSNPQGILTEIESNRLNASFDVFKPEGECQKLKCDYTTESIEHVPEYSDSHHLIATTKLPNDEGSITPVLQATNAADNHPMQTIMDDSLAAHRTFQSEDAVTHPSGTLTDVTQETQTISQTLPSNGPVEATGLIVESRKPKYDDTEQSTEHLHAIVNIVSNDGFGIGTVEDTGESEPVLEPLPEQTAAGRSFGSVDSVTHTPSNLSSTPINATARQNTGRRSNTSEIMPAIFCLQGMGSQTVTDDLSDISGDNHSTSTMNNTTVIERQSEEISGVQAILSSKEICPREVSAAGNDSICKVSGSGKIEKAHIAIDMPEEQQDVYAPVSVADVVLHNHHPSQSRAPEDIEGDGASFQRVEESGNDDSGVLSGTDSSLVQVDGLNDNTPLWGTPGERTSVELQQDPSLPCSDVPRKASSAPSGDEKEDSTSAAVECENEVEKFYEGPTVASRSDVLSNQPKLPEGDSVQALSQTSDKKTGDTMQTTNTVLLHMADTTLTADSGTTSTVGPLPTAGAGMMSELVSGCAVPDGIQNAPAEEIPEIPGHGMQKMQHECASEENVFTSTPETQHIDHDCTFTTAIPLAEHTLYFDALGTSTLTVKSESPDSASVPRSEGGIFHSHGGEETALRLASVKSASPETHTYSQQGMDFAGVSVGGTTRLSGSEDTVLYDENVNPFAPQSVLPSGSVAPLEKSDSNDNIVGYNEGRSGDGDRVASTGYNVKPSEVKLLRANRRSFTVRKDPRPEDSNPVSEVNSEGKRSPACQIREEPVRELRANRRSFTVRKDTQPEEVNSKDRRAPVCQIREEPVREPKPNCSSTTVNAPAVRGAWEPLPETCGDLCTKPEVFPHNEDLLRDSEAGPEVAEFSEDEFRCAFEHFKDPSAFDFLQKFGDSKQLGRSSLGRCSLFLKFDPLLADGRPSFAPPKEIKGEKSPLPNVPSAKSKSEELIDWDTSPKVTKQELPQDLLSAALPAESDPVKTKEQMFSEKEMSQALKFQELMFQERLLKKEQEQSEEQKQMQHRFEIQDNAIRQMYQAVKHLARTCEDAGKERQRLIADVAKLTKERDQLVEDLRGVEAAFSDFHRRYEQAKDIIRTMKENETLLRNQLTEAQTMLDKRNQMLSTLKTKAEESLETASKEIESSRKTMDAENTVLKAQLKKAEMKINSLEKHLEQKTEENSQLTQMYDDLLSKVQQH